jgi:biotin carboxylase
MYPDLAPSAVIPVSDYGVPFAARLAERYGVPGAGFGAAILLRDKELQRRVSSAAGIANPESVAVDGPDAVRALLAEVGGPIVLKPANRRAALGTKIVSDASEVDDAWQECIEHDEGVLVSDRPMALRMLAERCVRGPEYSVEMLVRGGRSVFAGVTKKFLFDGDRPIELGHLHPAADLDAELNDRLIAETVRVVEAFGMHTGIVHCEWIIERGLPYLVECAGRMAGDGIIELVMVAWQYDIVAEFFAIMAGREPVAPPEKADRYCAVWLPHAPVGYVERVDGAEAAKASPGVHTCAISVKPGDEVHPLRSSWDRIALITAEGATADEALANARAAANAITVHVR